MLLYMYTAPTDHPCFLSCSFTELRWVRQTCSLKRKPSEKTSIMSQYWMRRVSIRMHNISGIFVNSTYKAFKYPRKVCIFLFLKPFLLVIHQWLTEMGGDYCTTYQFPWALTLATSTLVLCFDHPCCFCHSMIIETVYFNCNVLLHVLVIHCCLATL